MSLLAELTSAKGSTHKKKRIGRGDGSGYGGTAAKGHKGQLARTGGRVRRGFEGGQTPLARRIPKFGFKNPNHVDYTILNLADLNRYEGEVSPETLVAAKFMKKDALLKILGNGKLEKAINVKAHKMSKTAKEAIEKAGGSVELITDTKN